MRVWILAMLGFLALFAICAASASAGPAMSWRQSTSNPGVGFGQCWNRAPQALRSVGMTAIQDGRFFHGYDNAFTVSVICYDLGNNRFIVTVEAAQNGASSMTTDQVCDRILAVVFGANVGTSAPPAGVGIAGHYRCVGSSCQATQALATVEQNGNQVTFINEFGRRSRGHFLDAHTVYAEDWDLRATISTDLRVIYWSNGVQWVRQ